MAEDVVKVGTPSLLVHFPNLQRWGTGSKLPLSEFPTQAVKNCVSKWCPKLSEIETISTPSILLCHLLVNVFTGLTTFVFEYDDISSDMIMAVLRYPTSWTTIATYTPRDGFYEDFAEDGVYDDPDHFQSSGWMIQSLLRICYKLKIFNVQQHVMDLDDIEREPWVCTDLEDIAFRIRGLDTRDKIERAILISLISHIA
ncbi:hypothetical protein BGZ99_007933 [Dissophora globulifera]|uniref:Uncharacterized protein n=1 Tax=Dissophora globulifera TaxID=979702 RepID=A0A9P6RAD3_9FUNG|nr:hypothetical protein BGZ99_007933 [Dissophora globulifera]